MRKRDYRPYCFDPCNEPLKTRMQMLLDAFKHIEIPEVEVTADIDEAMLNKAIEKAIKNNPVSVEVDIDSEDIVTALNEDLCKVHAHITRAENEIIETLSCNCGGNDCGCSGDCNCSHGGITAHDLEMAVESINAHMDEAVAGIDTEAVVEGVNAHVDEAVARIDTDSVVENINAHVDDAVAGIVIPEPTIDTDVIANKVNAHTTFVVNNSNTVITSAISSSKEELLNSYATVKNEITASEERVKAEIGKVDRNLGTYTVNILNSVKKVEDKVDDFRALYESYHD